jgi:hypothetical protein
MDKRIILVIALAALITIVGVGAFGGSLAAPDNYYNYALSVSDYVPDTPLVIGILATEKASGAISSCAAANTFDFNKCNNAEYYRNQAWCSAKTAVNARSFKVYVDGEEIADTYYYPQSTPSYEFNSPLTGMGAVCCWEVSGACSVCADMAANPQYKAFPFVTTLTNAALAPGSVVATLTVTPPFLSQGTHTIDVYYYADTVFSGTGGCVDAHSQASYFAISGMTNAGEDKNEIRNTHSTYTFTVGENVADDGTGGLDGGLITPPDNTPTQTNGIILIGVLVVAVIFGARFFKKK